MKNRFREAGITYRAGVIALALILPPSFHAFAQPAKGYDVISYNATVTLEPAVDSLFGEVTMQARMDDTASIGGVLQYAKFLTIDSVFVNGSRASFTFDSTAMFDDSSSGAYQVIANLGHGAPFTVTTYYHGKGTPEQDSYKWGGVTDEDSLMFAMGVGFQTQYTGCTRHWLPCYDLPDDKADSVDFTFITPASDITASNGLLISNVLTPRATRIMHWHESHPIATYLLTFATGPLTEQNIPNALAVPFEVYALASDSERASNEMRARVAPILAFYDSLFAPYPFEKVGYVVTPIGSMEHQTMISLDTGVLEGDSAFMAMDTSVNGTTAVHELSHMWWGDRLTCKTFDDAWLNEGFAHFCESLVLERLFGREKYLSREHTNAIDARGSTLPLFGAATADNHSNNYPYSTIYEKGAAVLGMLRQFLGDSIFFEAVRFYGDRHAYTTVTSYDLWNDFDTISGQDLGWFFKPWVFGTGYPKDTIVWSKTANGASITFQQARNNAATPYFRMPIPVHFGWINGFQRDTVLWMDSTQTSASSVNYGSAPDSAIFDPDGLLVMRIIRVTQVVASVAPLAATGGLTLRAFPNPDTQDLLEISLDAPHVMGMVSVTLSDEKGRIIKRLEQSMTTNHLDLSLSIAGLPSGNYILSASSGSVKAIQKISISK